MIKVLLASALFLSVGMASAQTEKEGPVLRKESLQKAKPFAKTQTAQPKTKAPVTKSEAPTDSVDTRKKSVTTEKKETGNNDPHKGLKKLGPATPVEPKKK